MTKRDDPSGNPDLTPQGNAPSWVDEVLGASSAPASSPAAQARPSGPDLGKERPAPPAPPRPPLEGPENLRIPEPERPTRPDDFSSDDWIGRMTGGAARSSGPAPTGRPQPGPSYGEQTYADPAPMRSDWAQTPQQDTWGDQRPAVPYAGSFAGGDVAQRKLIAGLLAIFLGSLGVHKFYLGMNRPGALVLGLNVGAWVLAILLGIVTLAVGFIVTLPLASLLSFALGVLGLVEGIIYLTKTDEAFGREYLIGKKAWL